MLSMRRVALTMAGLSLAAAAAVPLTAGATAPGPDSFRAAGKAAATLPTTAAQAATTACGVAVGAVNATGTAGGYHITATKPPTVANLSQYKLFGVRASSTWYEESDRSTDAYYGMILQGANLYAAATIYTGTATTPTVRATKLGTGWSGFSHITDSNYVYGANQHYFLYGLHANGSIYRYKMSPTPKAYGSAPGFSSVRAMTLIAETATYDTLLVTTRGGQLYTVRIPVTAPMKPIVTQVRATGFGGYDELVAQRCGATSTLLTAFDHDTNLATVFAVGHTTGPTTPIRSFGSFKATFGANVNFLLTGAYGPQRLGD